MLRSQPLIPFRLALIFLILATATTVFAGPNKGAHPTSRTTEQLMKKGAGGCPAASARRELDINNVRTMIMNGGDMWWNLSNARYEIPKVQSGQISRHSLDAGALWIGGLTNGNIRIAAQTYRQSGNDFYPGPLTLVTASITADECLKYDRIWRLTNSERESFIGNPNAWSNPPEDILTWPAHGHNGQAQFLAPFYNVGGDPLLYEPGFGDYPAFHQQQQGFPDMLLFTITNDKGNIHSETEGIPIGLELQTQSFAWSTNDELNDMTFYRTTIINRSNEKIDSCRIGQWADTDLGNMVDDYVEYDVNRNLAICYNGDDNDEGILGYGLNPPAVGVNMLQGPKHADGTPVGVTRFLCYENSMSPINGNPSKVSHYWNYLKGCWKNGEQTTYGGNGISGTDTTSYMYPGTTDPAGRLPWTEASALNASGDRRILMSSGPFSMMPGAVNIVTIAVVWARTASGGPLAALPLLKQASDKAYAHFKNTINGVEDVVNELKKVQAYPNPGNDELCFSNLPTNASQITLYDLSGRELFTKELVNHSFMSIEALPAGVYLYKISDRKGQQLHAGKWMKN